MKSFVAAKISTSQTYQLFFSYISWVKYQQGRSHTELHKEGVLNSAGLCSVEIQIHYLAKHLDTKENAHHLVYDYSHYIVKIKLFASYKVCVHCNILNATS